MEISRSFAKILSNSNFKRVIRDNDPEYFYIKLDKFLRQNGREGIQSNLDFIKVIYKHLLQSYRNEYVYKNTVFNKIVLGKHNLRTTKVLNEFKIGKSIADTIVLNGEAHVFEIKTELDSLQKLNKQISDYQKAFTLVSVILHEKDRKNILELVPERIGIYQLTTRGHISEIRKPESNSELLDTETMHKCLRKEEYSRIIQERFGELPVVPNTLFYKECRKFLNRIPEEELHLLMLRQLKERNLVSSNHLESSFTPKELKHICYCLNLTVTEYDKLYTFLAEKV